MKEVNEYIVVGSGPSGAMAAQTLVESGKQVLMLDVGKTTKVTDEVPEKDFITLRKTDEQQYRYFLGHEFEGISWGKVGKGEQVTPPRKHMMQSTDQLTPVVSKDFSAFESLGYGGLGIGWGIGCWEWSDTELDAAGLDTKEMSEAYNVVAKRIGISATDDDAAAYTIKGLKGYQNSADMDHNHRLLYSKYIKKRGSLRKKGFTMGRAPLALLTEDLDGRQKYSYKDMDFYTDKEQSAYRPWITVEALKKQSNFTYVSSQLVLRFTELDDHVTIECLDVSANKQQVFRAKELILASGVLGTARIVLRSTKAVGVRLPILCNPYSYIPCVQMATIGKEAERHKLGFAQLSFFLDEAGSNHGAAMASLYSYQSLMLFRMVRQVPLNFRDARLLLRYLASGIIIMGIHQPDSPSKDKYVELIEDKSSPSGDALRISYKSTVAEQKLRHRREKMYMKAMRSMGVHALKRIDPGIGSSIHYAGALPCSVKPKPFTLSPDGRLNGTSHVYVADGSGFRYLPAKGLTFSLMANAHRIAKKAMKS